MPVTQNDLDEVFNNGVLVSSTPIVRDVTVIRNSMTLRDQATAALATNTDALALPDPTSANQTYIALAAPSLAQITAQVRALTQQNNALVAQVRALTQQNNKLIRLALGLYDATT